MSSKGWFYCFLRILCFFQKGKTFAPVFHDASWFLLSATKVWHDSYASLIFSSARWSWIVCSLGNQRKALNQYVGQVTERYRSSAFLDAAGGDQTLSNSQEGTTGFQDKTYLVLVRFERLTLTVDSKYFETICLFSKWFESLWVVIYIYIWLNLTYILLAYI